MRPLLIGLLLVSLLGAGCEQLKELVGAQKSAEQRARMAIEQGEALLHAGKLDEAEAAFQEALKLRPNHPGALFGLASIYAERGEDARALLELGHVALLAPQHPGPPELMGDILMRQGKYEKAAARYEEAAARRSEDTALRLKLAEAYLRAGKEKEAEAAIDAVLDADPTHSEALAMRGALLAAQGNFEVAERVLKDAAAHATSPAPWSVLGSFLLKQGRPAEAVDALRRALEKDPENPRFVRDLAEAMIEAGDAVAAADLLAPWTQKRPNDAAIHAAYARALIASGRAEDALAHAKTAVRLMPHLVDAWLAQGEALEGTGDLDGAVRAYRSAAKQAPEVTDVYRSLARVYEKLGNLPEAIASSERVAQLDPSDRRARIHLAELYADSPIDAGKGKRLVEELLAEDPGDPKLLALKRRLEQAAKRAPPRPKKRPTGPLIIKGR
ncbi:MAG: tetratricopeptide repeat protein [Deltaproteobacteria bacterium]|nr:MAG: tetratricopeptide repeat protein [Deltaproteobacteria bacterium]